MMATTDERLRVLEVSHRLINDQQAEMSVRINGLDARMREAIAAGLRDVLADEELMDGVLDRLLQRIQRGAAERTGRWLWSSLGGILNKWVLIAVIVILVSQAAGLAPAKAVLGWMTKG